MRKINNNIAIFLNILLLSANERREEMKKKIAASLVLSFIIITATGCGVVLTSQKGDIYQQTAPPNTVGYFLPKGLIRVKLTPSQDSYDLTIESLFVPDPDFFYTLAYDPSAWADDSIKVTLSENSLISTIEVTTEDKTSAIVEKVIGIVKDVVKSVSLPVPGAAVAKGERVKVLAITFDPNKPEDIREVTNKLEENGISIKITSLKGKGVAGTTTYQDNLFLKGNSIYYRPLVPYKITLEAQDVIKSEIFYLPNGAPILSMDINRAPFIKKTTKLSFTNGILTSVEINKPSEVLGGLEIPAQIAKAILEIPGELIQLKIDTTKKYKELYQEQLNTIKAKDAMIEYLLQRGKGQEGGQASANPFSPGGRVEKGSDEQGKIKSEINKQK
jgi:hypothetical protein